MRRLILHIGRHKSGTTALQHWLGAHRGQLAEQGIAYPLTGAPNRIAHHAIAEAVNPRRTDASDMAGLAQALRAEAGEAGTLLLSSEAFQNVTDTTRLGALIAALGVREVEVIAYVREHLDYAISGWRQAVHNQPGFQPFRAYATTLPSAWAFVARWEAVGRLKLGWYDRKTLRHGDVVADFCARAGIAPGPIVPEEHNPSIGGNLLAMKLAANKAGVEFGDYALLGALAAEVPAFRSAFRVEAAAAAALRKASDWNAGFSARLGQPRLQHWAGAPELPERAQLGADLELVLGRIGTDPGAAFHAALDAIGPAFAL